MDNLCNVSLKMFKKKVPWENFVQIIMKKGDVFMSKFRKPLKAMIVIWPGQSRQISAILRTTIENDTSPSAGAAC
jgi:hypothetical protein